MESFKENQHVFMTPDLPVALIGLDNKGIQDNKAIKQYKLKVNNKKEKYVRL